MNGKKDPQYFIALLPPEPILGEVWEFKLDMQARFNSKASLNSPAHITLHMPFTWPLKKEEQLLRAVEKMAVGQHNFHIQLLNFSSFDLRVIFVDVKPEPALLAFQKKVATVTKEELFLFNANHREKYFHPHMTIAFRDLKKEQFVKAWNEYSHKHYQRDFEVHSLFLLKHDGKKWNIQKEQEFLPAP